MTGSIELRVHLFGAFRVLVNDIPVPATAWRSRRASTLVKLLALAPHYSLPREHLAETLWPDFALDAQLNNLNVATTRARRALASTGAPTAPFLTLFGDLLQLGPPESVWTDADAFEQGVMDGWRTLDPARCRAALAVYNGDLLPDDLYDEWAEERRAAFRTQFLALSTRLGELYCERGDFHTAVEICQRNVSIEPASESAHVALIHLYARLGQRAQAIAQYDQLVLALRRLLDAEPERETVEFVEAIRSNTLPLAPDLVTASPDSSAVRTDLLPAPLDSFIGRERERAEIRSRLDRGSRLVTLTGPGGIGKTRLALAVVCEIDSSFPDGIRFVDLSSIRDGDLVVPAIAQALGSWGISGPATLSGLIATLFEKRLLIVLDNAEQVIDAVAAVTIALLKQARGCALLVTSRVALRIRGEIEYPVMPLPLPEPEHISTESQLLQSPATALFVQRARVAKPDFTVVPGAIPAIIAICHRLDGLPLAIELAAARVAVLSPPAMLARLNNPLAFLIGGPRDLPPRQQTIRSTIAWSFDLLTPAEQRLLSRLSVFAGGWTLDAAEAVVDPAEDMGVAVLDGLASLVAKNLVAQRDLNDGEHWFSMLETIHDFAAEQLADRIEGDLVRDAHARYMTSFTERVTPHLEGGDQLQALARLDREEGNLRAALEWLRNRRDVTTALRLVTALKLFWFVRGRLAEGCAHVLAVTAMPGAGDSPVMRIDALNCAAFLARENRDYECAYQASGEARTEAERLGDGQRAADAIANLGYVALQRGKRQEANRLFHESLEVNRANMNQQGIADSLSFLGLAAYYDGDLDRAQRLQAESVVIWELLNDRQAISWARSQLGLVLVRQGAFPAAYAEFMTSLTIARELDFPWGLSWSLDGLARISALQGAHDLTLALISAAAAIRSSAGLLLPAAEENEIQALHAWVQQFGKNGVDILPGYNPRNLDGLFQRIEQRLGQDLLER